MVFDFVESRRGRGRRKRRSLNDGMRSQESGWYVQFKGVTVLLLALQAPSPC